MESSHSQRHPPPPPTPTRHHQNKSYQIASDSEHGAILLIKYVQRKCGAGGGRGLAMQHNFGHNKTKARAPRSLPVHYHTTDPVAAQATAHDISRQSSCPLVVVWLWMHLNPRGEHVCVEMHVDSAHGWMSLTPLTKTLLGKSVQSEVETESPRNL